MLTAEQARDVKYTTVMAILKEIEMRIMLAVAQDNQTRLVYWVETNYIKLADDVVFQLKLLGYKTEVKKIEDSTYLDIKWGGAK